MQQNRNSEIDLTRGERRRQTSHDPGEAEMELGLELDDVSAGETASRGACTNNLKQFGVAAHNP